MKRDVLWKNGLQKTQSGKIAHFAKAIKITQKMTQHAKEMFYGKTA